LIKHEKFRLAKKTCKNGYQYHRRDKERKIIDGKGHNQQGFIININQIQKTQDILPKESSPIFNRYALRNIQGQPFY
jgi:hypothetical protein